MLSPRLAARLTPGWLPSKLLCKVLRWPGSQAGSQASFYASCYASFQAGSQASFYAVSQAGSQAGSPLASLSVPLARFVFVLKCPPCYFLCSSILAFLIYHISAMRASSNRSHQQAGESERGDGSPPAKRARTDVGDEIRFDCDLQTPQVRSNYLGSSSDASLTYLDSGLCFWSIVFISVRLDVYNQSLSR